MSDSLGVLCVIDHFGSGGAQRQMVNLACGLRRRGHTVHVFVYHPAYTFFRRLVEEAGIPILEYNGAPGWRSRLGILKTLARVKRAGNYDAVVSFLNTPNVYAELTQLAVSTPTLIVSERSSRMNDRSFSLALARRMLHFCATHVVANSQSHQRWLWRHHRWLRSRLAVIHNGFDLTLFEHRPTPPDRAQHVRLIAVGRVSPEKNLIALIDALGAFSDAHGWVPTVHWVGRRDESTPTGRAFCERVDRCLRANPAVENVWTWLGERKDIPDLLGNYHALILPSEYEGFPNAICEALAAGLPVLASDVGDNAWLVSDGERGFLFDPDSTVSIVAAMKRLAETSEAGWKAMSCSARKFAEEHLSSEQMVAHYERLMLVARGDTLA